MNTRYLSIRLPRLPVLIGLVFCLALHAVGASISSNQVFAQTQQRPITALSTNPGATSLYEVGRDGRVWSKFFPDVGHPDQWSNWFSIGSNVFPKNATVTALSLKPNATSLYVMGLDGRVWSNFFPAVNRPNEWQGWFPLGPNVFPKDGTVTAISTNPSANATSLYVIGLDGQVWSNFFPAVNRPNEWQGWFPLGTNVFPKNATVTALSLKPNATSLYVMGLDGQVWSNFFPAVNRPNEWQGWFPLGPNTFPKDGTVTAISTNPAANATSLYVMGLDDQAWTSFFPDPQKPGQWSAWLPLESSIRYQVYLDGFNFANFIYNGANPSWDDFTRTFPGTEMTFLIGLRRKGPERFFQSVRYRNVGDGGNCQGFTAISLISYKKLAESVEQNALRPTYRSYSFVHDLPAVVAGGVSVGQSDVKDYIHLYQARQLSLQHAQWEGQHESDTPMQVYQEVQKRTVANEPVAIWIYGTGGAHSIVAYRTEEDPKSDNNYIYIYDSNYPDDSTRRITVNRKSNTWSYMLGQKTTWGGAKDMLWAPAILNFPATVPSAFDNNNPNFSIFSADDKGGTIVSIEGPARLLITDAQNRQIGYQGDSLVDTVPGAAPLTDLQFNPSVTNTKDVSDFFLPSGTPYTVTIQPIVGSGVYTITAYGGGSVVSFDHINITGNTSDQLLIGDSVRSTTFMSTNDPQYNQYLTSESMSSSRDFTSNISAPLNASVGFSLDSSGNRITVQNLSNQTISTTLTATQIGADPQVLTDQQLVQPGDSNALALRNHIYVPSVTK